MTDQQAPTVTPRPLITTVQVQAARYEADYGSNLADEQAWCIAFLAALGLEVSPVNPADGPNVLPDSARDVAGEQDTTDPLTDIAPGVIEGLRHLGDEYGPLGVVKVALTLWPDLAAVVRASGTTNSLAWLADEFDLRAKAYIEDSPGHDAYTSAARAVRRAVSGVTPGNPTREHQWVADGDGHVCLRCDGDRATSTAACPSPAPGDQQAEVERLRASLRDCAATLREQAEAASAARAELAALRAAITAFRAEVQPFTTVAAAWVDLRLGDALDGGA